MIGRLLVELLAGGGRARGVADIAAAVFRGGEVQEALRALLQGKANRLVARKAAEQMARQLLKTLETTVTETPGTPAQKTDVGRLLAENWALQAAEAAEGMLQLARRQGELEAARGTEAEERARAAREDAEQRFREQFLDLARLAR